jgi:Secretin and TonB N terminus short domain.
MHKPPFRFAPTRISLAVALLLAQAPVLHAQTVDNDRTVSIAISAQPLGSALNALSAATGIPIAFPPALVAGKNAAAVQGSLTPRAALTQLMNNSGLEVQQVNGTFVIRAAGTAQQSAAPLPQVVVKAAAENEENLPAAYAGGQVARGSRAGLLG